MERERRNGEREEGGREEGREGGREEGRKGGREKGRKGSGKNHIQIELWLRHSKTSHTYTHVCAHRWTKTEKE